MKIKNGKVTLLRVDINYIEKLNVVDSEVFFNAADPGYKNKPYFGILVNVNDVDYIIPFTSGKPKHLDWEKNNDLYLKIFENRKSVNEKNPTILYTKSDNLEDLKPYKVLISVLDFRKAIPIKDGLYTNINISTDPDSRRLTTEYNFCYKNRPTIIEKFEKMYTEQIETSKINEKHCDFKKLEECCKNYLVKSTQTERIKNEIINAISKNSEELLKLWVDIEDKKDCIFSLERLSGMYKKTIETPENIKEDVQKIGDKFKEEELKIIETKIKEEIKDSSLSETNTKDLNLDMEQ